MAPVHRLLSGTVSQDDWTNPISNTGAYDFASTAVISTQTKKGVIPSYAKTITVNLAGSLYNANYRNPDGTFMNSYWANHLYLYNEDDELLASASWGNTGVPAFAIKNPATIDLTTIPESKKKGLYIDVYAVIQQGSSILRRDYISISSVYITI